MKIRSITTFLNPEWPINDDLLQKAGEFITSLRPAYEQAGYEVQTVRLASIPFPQLFLHSESAEAIQLAISLEKRAREVGFDYVSLGPAQPQKMESYAIIPEILTKTDSVFAAGHMTTPDNEVSLPAVRACAQIIQHAATITKDGFANLRFAALANVPPGTPFFPAAYHDDEQPAFALATEAADLAVTAFEKAASLEEGRKSLVDAIENHAGVLSKIGNEFSKRFSIRFRGIDFTLAPFPQETQSLGTAMERIGVPAVGRHGSLAATAILADTLDMADYPRTGFNGVMLPVLEDSILATRNVQGGLSVTDLLLYSTVCGTGLDTIPLPGNTTVEQLAALLLDLAVLSLRLDKPLTARLMPIPGKEAGELTEFDFPFFANSRVMKIKATELSGFLASNEAILINQRIEKNS